MDREELNKISGEIIDAAIAVHRELGPGLLESAYQACLHFELQQRGLRVQAEVELPIVYQGNHIEVGYRLDLIVEGVVIIEAKAIGENAPIHKAQILSYLKLSKKPLGLLINFNVMLLKDGITRIAN